MRDEVKIILAFILLPAFLGLFGVIVEVLRENRCLDMVKEKIVTLEQCKEYRR